MSITLFYYPRSASLAPHLMLHHVQADYQLKLVDKKTDSQKSASYLRLNPTGRIPTLVMDEQPIFESAAICIHIAESFADFRLIPELGQPLRPLFFQWLTYLNNTLQNELMLRFYPQRHTSKPQQVESIKQAQEQRLGDIWMVIDQQLCNKRYLLGDELTACDYFLFMLATWSIDLQYSPLSFANLRGYLQRLARNATIVAVCRIEGIDLTRFDSERLRYTL
ncbi:glutathione S-transferase family protein [Vibrio taketomensis]|uniref:glutathione S-transferase family protein n=1 Tax=Vibrio taketomensis TaxID=2572923 RepID=UPI00138A05A3|nr:glutathione S-transferase family protein [Vibrio taketomensis]